MAQAKMVLNAIKLKFAVARLEKAKVNAIRGLAGLPPLRPWYENCYINSMKCFKESLLQAFCPCVIHIRRKKLKLCCCKPKSCPGMTCTVGTYHNEVFKNFMGFLGGTILSFILYLMMALSLELNMKICVGLGTLFGSILSIGLAFSDSVRCMVFLTLPNFFSSKGRSFLLMYAMILVMSHPVTNFSQNILVMADSATCGQSMALNETKELIKAAASPVASIIDGLREMLKSISRFANAMRKAFKAMKRAIQEICAAIVRIFSWLKSITEICNVNMGKPYQKCTSAFEKAASDCRSSMGIVDFLCSIVDVVKSVCHIARIGELLCIVVAAVVDFVADSIGAPINRALNNIYEMFYFNVTLNYHYNLTMTQSKSYSDVKKDIMNDIQGRLGNVSGMITAAETMMMFTFLLVFLRAVMYRFKYLTADKFDNIYLNDTLHFIDEKRSAKGMETIFPLSGKESSKYITTFSLRMAKNERKKMMKGMVFLIFSLCHASFYMLCDYSLYWILKLIQKHFEVKTNPEIPAHLKLHVQGGGAMADMYRAMIGLLDPVSAERLMIDTTPCLPKPGIPDTKVYKTVFAIFFICLMMSIFESYGLRLRHVIAGCYYPKREQARAVWLYNRIVKMRGKFLVQVRRTVRRTYKKDKEAHKFSIRARIAVQCPKLGKVLKFFGYERKYCLCCGAEGRPNDFENYQHCDSPGCDAIYCLECFMDLNNLCTVCMNPVDYGDASDMSEERDSSDDDFHILHMKELGRARKEKMDNIRKKNRPSNTMMAFKGMMGISKNATASEIMDLDVHAPVTSSLSGDVSSGSNSDLDYSYQNKSKHSIISSDSESDHNVKSSRKTDKVNQNVFDLSDSETESDLSSED